MRAGLFGRHVASDDAVKRKVEGGHEGDAGNSLNSHDKLKSITVI